MILLICASTMMCLNNVNPFWCVLLQLSLFPEFNTLSVMYGKLSFNFISQQVPYIITAQASSRGAGVFAVV